MKHLKAAEIPGRKPARCFLFFSSRKGRAYFREILRNRDETAVLAEWEALGIPEEKRKILNDILLHVSPFLSSGILSPHDELFAVMDQWYPKFIDDLTLIELLALCEEKFHVQFSSEEIEPLNPELTLGEFLQLILALPQTETKC